MANLYEAVFQDGQGKDFNARLRCGSDADAKTVADAMALKSDAKWTALLKITSVALPSIQTVDSTPTNVTTHYLGTPDAASDIQKKVILTYLTGVAGNYIRVEIPSVAPSYASKSNEKPTTDPLNDTQRAMLLSENAAAATAMKRAKYNYRKHRR